MQKILLIVTLLHIALVAEAQDPKRFQSEIDKIVARDSSHRDENLVVFAGSSTFRMWGTLQEDFPSHHILNHGFGGSEMSDLLFYVDELIIRNEPSQVFIYEGDNDLNHGKQYKEILRTADKLVDAIRTKLPATAEIIFVTAKPSPSRWQHKKKYRQFNRKLKRWTKRKANVKTLDTWAVMLDKEGNPKPELFIEDRLHMNAKGYALWAKVFKPYFHELNK
jgi:lysophospholipase L1-like esterase